MTDLLVLTAAVVLAFRARNYILRRICQIFLTVLLVYVLISVTLLFADAVRTLLFH